jgi:hypothetical protein
MDNTNTRDLIIVNSVAPYTLYSAIHYLVWNKSTNTLEKDFQQPYVFFDSTNNFIIVPN